MFKNLLTLLMMFMLTGHAYAETGRVLPTERSQIAYSYAPLVRQAAPAVVNIYTKRTVQRRVGLSPFMSDPFFERFFGHHFGRDFGTQEHTATSLGSGVIIEADGLVVTNAHVVEGANEINVILNDGREFSAKQIFSDPRVDLAVLKAGADDITLPMLAIPETTDLEVGDLVLAIGNPFGVGQTVTSGIVSALARTTVGVSDYSFFIQTDAAINPGNSGGALVGMNGDLVGINSAIYAARGGGSLGIGFAIPIELVRTVLNSVKRGETKLVQPWLGVTGQPVTSDIARSMGLSRARGALISNVHPQSGPGRAGLQTGDIVTHLNGKEVIDPAAMKFYLAMVEIGSEVTFNVLRRGEPHEVRFKAELPSEEPPRNTTQLEGRHPFNGVTVANINPAVMEELDLGATENGVAVMAPGAGSSLRLRAGDIIYRIGEKQIGNVAALQAALRQPARGWNIEILRDGRLLSVVLR